MRVLMFSTDKGAFDQASETRRRFAAYGELVESLHVLVIGADQTGEEELSDRVTLYPIKTRTKAGSAWKAFWSARTLIKKEKIGLVVTQSPLQTGVLGYLLAMMYSIKLLVSVYGMDIFDEHWLQESMVRRFTQIVGRLVLARADAIQTDGYETVDSLKAHYGDRVFWKPVVPSDITAFAPPAARDFGQGFRLLFVGRLVKQKNLPMLLAVLSEIAVRRPSGWQATIVGDGPLRTWLESELSKRQLSNYVTYRPKLSRGEMVQVYQDHHALVCTSAYEGFARIFLEAAASGLPIVTTKVSGVANLVEDGISGLVVKQNDDRTFVTKLLELMDDRGTWRKFSRNLESKFRSDYSFQVTIDRQKAVFDLLSEV